MIILQCTDKLNRVGTGFTCLVSVRSLRHLTTGGMVSALRDLGVPYESVDRLTFLDILKGLSIPTSAVDGGSDYKG